MCKYMCVLSYVCAGKDKCKNHRKTSQIGQNRHENRKVQEKPKLKQSNKSKSGQFKSIQFKAITNNQSQVQNHKSKGLFCKAYQDRGTYIAKRPKNIQDFKV